MQSGQQEHLQKLIDSSPILTPAEKAEWFDMLILMNDKQAGELEEILNAHHAIPPLSPSPGRLPVPPRAAGGVVPPLTHISNLPSGLAPRNPQPPFRPQTIPAPQAPPAKKMPWQEQFKSTMEEKELSAPAINPVPVQRTTAPARSNVLRPPKMGLPESGKIETLLDVGKLTLGAMRSMNEADLLIRLQQLSKMEGYFNLLSYLEDSPLYKAYIATGKKVLANKISFDGSNPPAVEETLTKEEFEQFADILRKIQIN